jgi:hypothetical protein
LEGGTPPGAEEGSRGLVVDRCEGGEVRDQLVEERRRELRYC